MLTLKLIDSIESIEDKINEHLANQINNTLARSIDTIRNRTKNLVYSWIESQPEIMSINDDTAGSLAGQFGLPSVDRPFVTKAIVQAVVDSTEVKFIKFNKKLINGGIQINVQPSNFSNLLSLPQGFVIYQKGTLHWLNWLLTGGDGMIIIGYEYVPMRGVGRSGLGHMEAGGAFRVSPQFSGTVDNNFITRALIGKSQESQLNKIFEDILS